MLCLTQSHPMPRFPAFDLAGLPSVPADPNPGLCFPDSRKRGDVYHRLEFILFLCFPIIDSNGSYRRPAEGKHVLLTQPSTSSWRRNSGGPRPQGKRGVTFPLVIFFFFHLAVGGQQNMFSFFSKGNRNFLMDYLLPKIHLPSPVIILDRVSCVTELQNKGAFFIALRGQPPNQNFHSHEAIDTAEIHHSFLVRVCAHI